MTRSKARWLLAILLVTLVACMLIGARPAAAAAGQPARLVPAGWAKPCDGTPNCGSGTVPTPDPTQAPPTSIVDNILSIPVQALYQALMSSAKKVVLEANNGNYYADDYNAGNRTSGANEEFARLVGATLTDRFGLAPQAIQDHPDQYKTSSPLFQELIFPYWQASLGLALALVPLTLALTVASVMQAGAGSALAYADLKEAIVNWLVGIALAASSYFLLALIHRLVLQVAGVILFGPGSGLVAYQDLANKLKDMMLLQMDRLDFRKLNASVQLLYGIFQLLFNFGLVLIVSLGYAGYIAVLFVLAVLAPAVFLLSTAPPLKWLQSTWIKGLTLVSLLPIVNALLVSGTLKVFTGALGAFTVQEGRNLFTDYGNYFKALIIAAGLLGLYLTINYKVMETVFGAAAEIAGKAGKATMDTLALAATLAVGAVALPALLGGAGAAGATTAAAGEGGATAAAGGTEGTLAGSTATGSAGSTTAAGGPTASTSGATGSGASAGTTSGTGNVGSRMTLAAQKNQATLMRHIGSAFGRSGLPGSRLIGGAMQAIGATREAEYGDQLAQADYEHAAGREQEFDTRHASDQSAGAARDDYQDQLHPPVEPQVAGEAAVGDGAGVGADSSMGANGGEPYDSGTTGGGGPITGGDGLTSGGGSPTGSGGTGPMGGGGGGGGGTSAAGGPGPVGAGGSGASAGPEPAADHLDSSGFSNRAAASVVPSNSVSDVDSRMRQASLHNAHPGPTVSGEPELGDTNRFHDQVKDIADHLPSWDQSLQYDGRTFTPSSGADHLAGLLAGEAERHHTPFKQFSRALSNFSDPRNTYEQPEDMLAGLDRVAAAGRWGAISPGTRDFVYRLYQQEPPGAAAEA